MSVVMEMKCNISLAKGDFQKADAFIVRDAIAMFREAKEKHMPVRIENEDGTRAVVVKDASKLTATFKVNGITFAEI